MLDIKWIRDDPNALDRALATRGAPPAAADLMALDRARRDALATVQGIQASRNIAAKEIGRAKARGEDARDLMLAMARSKDEEAAAGDRARQAEAELEAALAALPNIPAADVPEGADESANVQLRRWGRPRDFTFTPNEHFLIGEALGLMDFERATKLSGARFVVLTGALARLERALSSFMLDLHTGEFGYTEVSPPALVRAEAMFGTGQLPKFGDDLFSTSKINEDKFREHFIQLAEQQRLDQPDNLTSAVLSVLEAYEETRTDFAESLWLIPTAEVPLTNLVAGEILDEAALPLRLTAMTWCFRAEAGSAGRDTRGMIRQHQFTKVELVSITTPEQSAAEHERMTGCAEQVLQRLDLPYRVVALSTGDLGFAARKTYDIEVWLPGQGRYREISSCSNCGDFQARRMKARVRAKGEKATRFVHTLNGSALAVGRTLIAILENYQEADGSVCVPPALVPYMGGLERIDGDALPAT